jgi:hypothetical protein
MSIIKKLVVMFTAIAAAIGLFSIFSSDSNNTEVKFSPEIPQPQQQTKSEPTAEVQPAANGQDPFKKFLDEKAGNANLAAKSDNSQALPVQLGKDPFKEFLDKQKQNSKDQVVSPFSKN